MRLHFFKDVLGMVLLLFVFAASPFYAAELETWDGAVQSGTITSDGKSMSVQGKAVPLQQVFEIRFKNPALSSESNLSRITLLDGSSFAGSIAPGSARKTIKLSRPEGGKDIEFPVKNILSIELNPLHEGRKADAASQDGSFVIMRNGKSIAAKLEWFTAVEAGVKSSAGRLRLKREQIHRILFSSKKASAPPAGSFRATTLDGVSVYGKILSLSDKELALQATSGKITLPVKRLFSLSAVSPKVVSLLQLKPAGIKQTAFLELVRKPKRNSSLTGGPLRIDGVRFDRGFSTHSRTSILYDLGGKYKRFVVYVGLDTSLTDMGDAVFIVKGGSNQKLAEVPMTGGDGMKYLNIKVEGIKALNLTFDFGRNGSCGDYGVWGDPRLIR